MKVLVYTGNKQLTVEDAPALPLKDDHVRIQTMFSGISHGTEMNVYRGIAPFFKRVQDGKTRLFRDGDGGETWQYPVRSCDPGVWYMGYANVGRVIEIGSEVEGIEAGQLVYCNAPHQSEVVAYYLNVIPIPDNIKPEHAVIFTNLMTAYNGILDTRIKLGDAVVVSGLGLLGQLVVQMLKMSGASQVIAIDMLQLRREAALANGADYVLDPADSADVAAEVKKLTDYRGADAVIEVSGNARALQQAIRMAAYDTAVTALGWYPGESILNLSEEFHHNRISLRSSQTGGIDPSIGHMWNDQRKSRVCAALLSRLKLDNLLTHRIPYENVAKAYQIIDQHPEEVIQVILEY